MHSPAQPVTDPLRGVSVANKLHPIVTIHQLGGRGIVYNKALVIPLHLGEHINSIEHVVCAPGSSVGEHLQQTDEIYYVTQGTGELTTNGELCQVRAGDLVLAPRGTRHSVHTTGTLQGLGFLVLEVKAPVEPTHRPMVMEALPDALLHVENGPYTAIVGQTPVELRIVQVDLQARFAGPWGMLTLIELPAGCHLIAYALPEYDENLFVVSGHATIQLDSLEVPFSTDEDPTCGLNVLVPAGLAHQITNKSSKDPLLVLSIQVRHI